MTHLLDCFIIETPAKRWMGKYLDHDDAEFCLIWPFNRAQNGYPTAGKNNAIRPHRLMCERRNGPAPSSKHQAAHSCGKGHLGCVNMNSPFGGRNGLVPWLQKFFHHGNGIALVPDRTSAPWWQAYASRADLTLFVSPKLKFIGADGLPGDSPAQGTTLLASGQQAVEALHCAASRGLGVLMTPTLPRPNRGTP